MRRLIVITLLLLATFSGAALAQTAPPAFKKTIERHYPVCAWIISHEAGPDWRVDAGGDVNGSYGLPQAHPGTKMSTEGAGWELNAWKQWRWMRSYVASRYKDQGDCYNTKAHWLNMLTINGQGSY